MEPQTPIWRNRTTDETIADIRSEVAEQKKCVTQYSIQAIVFTTAVWGFTLRGEPSGNGLTIAIFGGLIVLIMVMVGRMANHKYATMNRNLGYELHLQRISDYTDSGFGSRRLALRMLEIGWEEAMCAWRIVQPTLFEHPYHRASNSFRTYRTRKGHRRCDKIPYRWYDTKALLPRGADYHPGNYLRNVHGFLTTAAAVSILIVAHFSIAAVCVYCNAPAGSMPLDPVGAPPGIDLAASHALTFLGSLRSGGSEFLTTCILPGLIFSAALVYLITQIRRHRSFRLILESELLSIQSCAVVWRVVAVCHIMATELALKRNQSYRRYTTYMAALAVDFNKSFYDPHEWLMKWEQLSESDRTFEELELMFPKGKEEAMCSMSKRKEVPPASASKPPKTLLDGFDTQNSKAAL